MSENEQILLGAILVEHGYATHEQIMQAVHLQERYSINEPLGEILIKEGIIKERELAHALDIQARRLDRKDEKSREMKQDAVFGRIAVAKGIVSKENLHMALREQAKRAYLGHYQKLGEVMVALGMMSMKQAARLLEYQHKRILMCPGCFLQFNVSRYKTGASFNCTRCGSALTIPNRVEASIVSDFEPESDNPAGDLSRESAKPVMPPSPHGSEASGDLKDVEELLEDSFMEDDLCGAEIGGTKLLNVIGRGGMGIVFKGEQISLSRPVAVKILSRANTSNEYYVKRFMIEAKAVAKLAHENIVAVYDYGKDGKYGIYYIIMELVEGEELLAKLLRDGPMPIKEAVEMAIQVSSALDAAARKQIIHRDIKPENIIITENGTSKVTDFGIAKNLLDDGSLTQGRVIGTPAYMSPEQVKGEGVDHRSDIYSLGVTLYAALAGRPPFIADNYLVVMNKHANEAPPSLALFRPEVSTSLQKVVNKMLAKKPSQRYQSYEEVIKALLGSLSIAPQEIVIDSPNEKSPQLEDSRLPIIITIIGIAVIGALIALFFLMIL